MLKMECHTLIKILLFCTFLDTLQGQQNNVCPRWRDYFTLRNNSNCWYNYAADVKVPELIRETGYPMIEYKARTRDGYILTIFRIPSVQSQKGPVFLMHGMQSTSGIFVGLGRESLAFMLADAGYDVWLGNYRGTEYSDGHMSLRNTQPEYWNYGVDEIALIDVPTMLNLVRQNTSQKIVYIGHSLGTTAAMMYACEFQQHAKDTVKLFVFMSPSYKLNNMRSPYRFFLPLVRSAMNFSTGFNLIQMLARNLASRLPRPTCTANPALMLACLNFMNLFLGPFSQISPENLPVLFNQLPGGTSLRTVSFLTDAVQGQFRKFDYGPKNMFIYGNSTPPDYNITRIEVPVYVFYASQDWATSKPDALNFYESLPTGSKYGIYEISNLRFNHFDFLFGKNARNLVYDRMIEVVDNFRGN